MDLRLVFFKEVNEMWAGLGYYRRARFLLELGADVISSDEPLLCVDLADQVAEVLDFFGLREVLGLGVTVGAYILTLFALKYKERVLGLILVSPICKAPLWTDANVDATLNALVAAGLVLLDKGAWLSTQMFLLEAHKHGKAGATILIKEQ
ncbi:hypothetical protein RIF29_00730 [Crotalaria pallida]|uniref:Uncharacterized protein n=1 Tax=Crotalaria pallida TaxID=3830 RepID=A0AAN9IW60_CROPI